MRSHRMNGVMLLAALVFALGALLLPLPAMEIIGVPLVAAGAYYGGTRGGVVVALWAILVVTVAVFVFGDRQWGDYAVSLVAYAGVGVGLGLAVDRLMDQRGRLQEEVERAEFARRELRASQRRYRLLFEASNDAVYLHGLDAAGEPTPFVAVNDAACRLLGYTREEFLHLTPRAIDAAETPGQLRRVMAELIQEGQVVYESGRRDSDGHVVPVEVSSSLTDVGGYQLVLSISRDIATRKKVEQRLELLSLRDELTGLFNRRGFNMMLPEQRKRAKRSGSPLLVLYGDIDDFKAINDARGHRFGDEVLAAVARAFAMTFRETDLVARMGGDEFCVVAEAGTDPEILSSRLEEAIAAVGKDLIVPLGLSFGIVVTDWRGLEDTDELLTRADMLMYEEKKRKRAVRSR